MWLFVYLVMRGVTDAAVINHIVTVAKVLPILVFIVIAIIAFKADVFTGNFWGDEVFVRFDLGLRVFRPAEAVLFGAIVLGAVAGVMSLATGAIEI